MGLGIEELDNDPSVIDLELFDDDVEVSKTVGKKNRKKDVTHLIQRMEELEKRCGIRLQAVYAELDKDWDSDEWYISVNCEAVSVDSTRISKNLSIRMNVYDNAGRVVATSSWFHFAEDFYAFATASIGVSVNVGQEISSIRLYPEPQ